MCVSMCWLVKRVENRCCAAPEKCWRASRVWGRRSEEGNGVTLCTVVQRCSSGSLHCTEGLPTGRELMGLALHTLFPRHHWSAHYLGSRFLGFLLSEGGICFELVLQYIMHKCFKICVKEKLQKWSFSSYWVSMFSKWSQMTPFLPPSLMALRLTKKSLIYWGCVWFDLFHSSCSGSPAGGVWYFKPLS